MVFYTTEDNWTTSVYLKVNYMLYNVQTCSLILYLRHQPGFRSLDHWTYFKMCCFKQTKRCKQRQWDGINQYQSVKWKCLLNLPYVALWPLGGNRNKLSLFKVIWWTWQQAITCLHIYLLHTDIRIYGLDTLQIFNIHTLLAQFFVYQPQKKLYLTLTLMCFYVNQGFESRQLDFFFSL